MRHRALLLLALAGTCAAQFFQFQSGGGGINLEDLMGGAFGGGGGGGGQYEELPEQSDEDDDVCVPSLACMSFPTRRAGMSFCGCIFCLFY